MLNGRQAWWRICMMKWEEILYFNRRKILLKKNCNGYPKRQLWLSKETNSVRTAISVAFEALDTVSSRSIFSYVVRLMKRLTYSVAFVVGSFSIVNEKPQIINITCFQINFIYNQHLWDTGSVNGFSSCRFIFNDGCNFPLQQSTTTTATKILPVRRIYLMVYQDVGMKKTLYIIETLKKTFWLCLINNILSNMTQTLKRGYINCLLFQRYSLPLWCGLLLILAQNA